MEFVGAGGIDLNSRRFVQLQQLITVKDLNFADEQIEIASTKHDHFRIVPFPKAIHDTVRRQVENAERFHREDAIENPNGFQCSRLCSQMPFCSS